MLSEPVNIIAIQPESIQVTPEREGTCQTCQLKSCCGQALSARQQKHSVTLPRHRLQGAGIEHPYIGQQGRLELNEASLVGLSLLFYLLPLLLLMLALVFSTLAGLSEGYAVLLAFSFFGLSFFILHKYFQKQRFSCQIALYLYSGNPSQSKRETSGLSS
jgi:positive regulator of sigma E activity